MLQNVTLSENVLFIKIQVADITNVVYVTLVSNIYLNIT